MENFEILNSTQLLEVTGGHNEMTDIDCIEDAIVQFIYNFPNTLQP